MLLRTICSGVNLSKNSDRYFIDYMEMYKDGVIYFTNSYGLYAYNPETKGYDCIYDQMENDTEYT